MDRLIRRGSILKPYELFETLRYESMKIESMSNSIIEYYYGDFDNEYFLLAYAIHVIAKHVKKWVKEYFGYKRIKNISKHTIDIDELIEYLDQSVLIIYFYTYLFFHQRY